jgi:hypothetical protein
MNFKRLKKYFFIKYDTEEKMGNKVSYLAKVRDLSLFVRDILLVLPQDYKEKRLVIEHLYTTKDKKGRDFLIIRFKSLD